MSETKKSNPDAWLRIEYYRKINSKYGCVLCEKTHLTKDCPHRNPEKEQPRKPDYNTLYSAYEQAEEETYGW
jgi:hypothetical protein